MVILKSILPLFLGLFISHTCISQSKNKPQKKNNKQNTSLNNFLKEVNKEVLTKESIAKKNKSKREYKTLFIHYFDSKTIVSPVKNGL